MWLCIVVGLCGIVMCLITYPAYNKILSMRKKKFKESIIELSNEIMN